MVTGHSLGLGWRSSNLSLSLCDSSYSPTSPPGVQWKDPSVIFYIIRWVQTARPRVINGHSHDPLSFSSELTTAVMASCLNGPASFVRHICFANVRWMESLSGDYDNAFMYTRGSLFSVWRCVGWGGVTFHLCVSPAGGKSNKSDWRHFGYWLKALRSARHSHLLGIPWRELQRRAHVFVLQCVRHWADMMNEFNSIHFEDWLCACVNYILLTASSFFHENNWFPKMRMHVLYFYFVHLFLSTKDNSSQY